ncbi:MAG: glycosyltransferase family 2 protein [Planctomycetota bacterium]|nr:glycosyltransferase family 2 protein [Planctomycetota bacterium]
MALRLSILICTHNRAALLARTLDGLAKIELPKDVGIELVVIENACVDNTVEILQAASNAFPFAFRWKREPVLGISAARNTAMREAAGEILAFLDDDVLVERGWAVEMLAAYEQAPADMVGGHVDLWWEAVAEPAWFNSGYLWILSGCDFGNATFEMKDAGGAIGANFSFRREVVDRIGGFRTDLGRVGRKLLSGEETDYVYRTLAAGFRVFHVPSVRVKHWVPIERATPQYIARAMAGFTRGHVMMKPNFGPITAARSIGGNLFLLAQHSIQRSLAAVRKDNSSAVRHRIRMAASVGALQGAARRLFNPPERPDPAGESGRGEVGAPETNTPPGAPAR